MSNPSDAPSVEFQVLVNNYICAASLVILFYDYFLTLSEEVERFWKTKRTNWASTFFYLNRYLSLLGHIPIAFQIFWESRASERLNICLQLLSYHQYLAVVIQTIVGILLIMRTYALYERRLRILLGTCAAAAAVIIYGTMCIVKGHKTNITVASLPPFGCTMPLSESDSLRLASAWTGMLCFDILIFVMTVYKSVTRKREVNSTLLNVLLLDGAIYFGVMVIAGVTVIVTFRVLPPYERGLTVILTNIMSSTMISRLMLNLRDPKLVSSQYHADGTRMFTTMAFESHIDTTYENTQNEETIPGSSNSDIEMMPRMNIIHNTQQVQTLSNAFKEI
ncbi:hypothetical protein BDQ17DRAFT_1355765 [Cyathus striatus]|nr:hypothetical protein BDQ17DRAFT_1355765 [Cyathus striatus]